MKPKHTLTRTDERNSVVFHRVGEVEFRLTPQNRVFLKIGQRTVFPHLSGRRMVRFDDSTFEPSPAVVEALQRILNTQREIRMGWPSAWEDEAAFSFTDEV